MLCLPVWGLNWPIMKIALIDMPPVWLAEARMASTCVCLFIGLGLAGTLRLPRRDDWPAVWSVGALMMGIYPALTMTGLLYAEACRAALLSFVTPLWVTPAAILLLGERPTALKLAGLVVGLGGLAVLFNPLGFDWSNADVVFGNLILVGASMVWSITIIHMRTFKWRLTPLQLAPWQLLLASLVIAPCGLWFESGKSVNWTPDLFAMLLFAGPIATFLTIWGAISIMRALPAVTSSLAFLATPVSGMLASALVLGEPLTVTNLTGLALLVVGLGFVGLAETKVEVREE